MQWIDLGEAIVRRGASDVSATRGPPVRLPVSDVPVTAARGGWSRLKGSTACRRRSWSPVRASQKLLVGRESQGGDRRPGFHASIDITAASTVLE